MTFEITVQHPVVGDETVNESFENVREYTAFPGKGSPNLKFDDERDDKKLRSGEIVRVVEEEPNND